MEDLRLLDLARQKKYREAHPEYHRARSKAWREKNKERRREYKRAHPYDFRPYYEKNKARLHEKVAAYRRAHPESARESEARRRARKRGAGGRHTSAEWLAKVAASGGRCAYCGRTDLRLTRDHVIPVSKGGSDDISNIVPACGPCNSRKRNKILAA